jgi:hypothetical protein
MPAFKSLPQSPGEAGLYAFRVQMLTGNDDFDFHAASCGLLERLDRSVVG